MKIFDNTPKVRFGESNLKETVGNIDLPWNSDDSLRDLSLR